MKRTKDRQAELPPTALDYARESGQFDDPERIKAFAKAFGLSTQVATDGRTQQEAAAGMKDLIAVGVTPTTEILEAAVRNPERPAIEPHARKLIQNLARGIGGPQ